MLLDIHSHYAAPIAGESIWNVEPAVFSPIEGNYYSVGIHPWKAGAVREEEWRLLREAVEHPAVLAIGEAGLDKLMPINRHFKWQFSRSRFCWRKRWENP